MSTNVNTIQDLADREYKWGFVTEVEEERVPKGLNEDIIRVISAKKNEPEFMLQWRLKAYRHWVALEKAQAEPKWANVKYGPIDYQDIVYYSAPKQKPGLTSLEELQITGPVAAEWILRPCAIGRFAPSLPPRGLRSADFHWLTPLGTTVGSSAINEEQMAPTQHRCPRTQPISCRETLFRTTFELHFEFWRATGYRLPRKHWYFESGFER